MKKLPQEDGGQDGEFGLGADDDLDQGLGKAGPKQTGEDEALVVLQKVGSENENVWLGEVRLERRLLKGILVQLTPNVYFGTS